MADLYQIVSIVLGIWIAIGILKYILLETFMQPLSDIKRNISDHSVVLFMKGVPGNSACSFSSRLVQILENIGVTYVSHDVLQFAEQRKAVKEFTGIKTLPQLFVNGEFFGGSDEMRRHYIEGTLIKLFDSYGVSVNPSLVRLEFEDITKEDIKKCAKAGGQD